MTITLYRLMDAHGHVVAVTDGPSTAAKLAEDTTMTVDEIQLVGSQARTAGRLFDGGDA